jgi:endonuclease I
MMVGRNILLLIGFQFAVLYSVSVDGQDTNSSNDPWADLTDAVYDDCAVETFYSTLLDGSSDPTKWDRNDIINLLTRQHRNTLPIVNQNNPTTNSSTTEQSSESEYILSALIDLFPGAESDTIRLWLREVDVAVSPSNTPESWKRGDVWPIELGTNFTNATTDVHAKRPVDWSANDALVGLKMGECGTVESIDLCVTPATTETANDTSQDGKILLPPASTRGDVARALLYNQLRYEVELGLRLTDCPPFSDSDYGYLSPLLQWHMDDPVDEIEVARNTRICSRWQGNRNVFIDYPELVEAMYGLPGTIKEGTNLYAGCIIPTESPTATPNECSRISPGDVQIYMFNSNNEPKDDKEKESQIVFFPLMDISADVEHLYVTDMGWNGTDFVTDEGVARVRSLKKLLSKHSEYCTSCC